VTLGHIVETMTDKAVETVALGRIVATVNLYTIVAFDVIVLFVVPFLALLTSFPVMWRKERHCNFSVLQRVQLSYLVF
jgi:hypothetical protein